MSLPDSESLPRDRPAAPSLAARLSSEVIEEIAIGGQLPSEADLAGRFGVSRVTVREALKLLAGQGLVSLSRGRRAVVTQPDGALFGGFLRSLIKSDPRAMFDLLQVRRVLEVQSVQMACRNAGRAGLAAVESALEAMRVAAAASDGGDGGGEAAFVAADVRFHQAIALAGGNRVLTYLFEAMEPTLMEAFLASQRGQRHSGKSLMAGYVAHRTIFAHVRARDEKAAADAMMALLSEAEQHLRWAMDAGASRAGRTE
jgi:GntR family transcriptional repressor for pyruvate dehydrogenase complex